MLTADWIALGVSRSRKETGQHWCSGRWEKGF